MEVKNEKNKREISNYTCIDGSTVYTGSKHGSIQRQPAVGKQVAISTRRLAGGAPRAAAPLGVDGANRRVPAPR